MNVAIDSVTGAAVSSGAVVPTGAAADVGSLVSVYAKLDSICNLLLMLVILGVFFLLDRYVGRWFRNF